MRRSPVEFYLSLHRARLPSKNPPALGHKSRTARRSIPTISFRWALPRQPREGGMAVSAVCDGGVETSPMRNPKIPCRACGPLANMTSPLTGGTPVLQAKRAAAPRVCSNGPGNRTKPPAGTKSGRGRCIVRAFVISRGLDTAPRAVRSRDLLCRRSTPRTSRRRGLGL